MAILIGIPILIGLIMLQTAVVSTLPLLQGSADLILLVVIAWAMQERVPSSYEWAVMAGLMVGAITAAPFYVHPPVKGPGVADAAAGDVPGCVYRFAAYARADLGGAARAGYPPASGRQPESGCLAGHLIKPFAGLAGLCAGQ
jgi:hypothetical protein